MYDIKIDYTKNELRGKIIKFRFEGKVRYGVMDIYEEGMVSLKLYRRYPRGTKGNLRPSDVKELTKKTARWDKSGKNIVVTGS